jgi:hypothetical protein
MRVSFRCPYAVYLMEETNITELVYVCVSTSVVKALQLNYAIT